MLFWCLLHLEMLLVSELERVLILLFSQGARFMETSFLSLSLNAPLTVARRNLHWHQLCASRKDAIFSCKEGAHLDGVANLANEGRATG